MATRLRQHWIVAMGAVGLSLPISVVVAGDKPVTKKTDETAAFRAAVLERFDTNQNGRLDAKEKAAALRDLTNKNKHDAELTALRQQILARFDKNHNGKLERQEIRTALASVNPKSEKTSDSQNSETATTSSTLVNRKAAAAAIARDPSASMVFVAQQLMSKGLDEETAQAVTIQKFDLNGDGIVDQSELAIAQAALLQQLAQAAAPTVTTPIATTTSGTTATGTTTTGTTSTGTGTSTTGTTGCTSGSSGSSGSGTTGSSTTGTTAQQSALNNLNNAARANGFRGAANFRRGR